MRYANSLLLVWFAYHVLLVGIVPVLSVLLVTAAAAGAGSLLLPKRVPSRLAFAVISGLGIIAGITGWLLPFPIHFHRGYVIVALAICWWRRRAIAKILLDQRKVWQLRVNASPRLAAVALMALGLASTGTCLPNCGNWAPRTAQRNPKVYADGWNSKKRADRAARRLSPIGIE